MSAVLEFAKTYGLQDIQDLLVSGAKVARDPEGYENIPGLTLKEKKALEKEKGRGFWHQKKELRMTIITCAIAAIVQCVS